MYIYWKKQYEYCVNKDKYPYQEYIKILINKYIEENNMEGGSKS